MAREQTADDGADGLALGVRVDPGDAWVGNIRLDLTRQEFRALSLLASVRGRTVTRDAFAEAVWPEYGGDVGDASIDQLITRLRRKLTAADPALRHAIVTLKGRGFRLEGVSTARRPQPAASVHERPSARVGNLPVPLTHFIGRVRELAEVQPLLGSTRLLTLTGAGGCGKTRLAIELAAMSAPAYADGVWSVELATLTDPDLVPQALAAALAIPEEAGRSPTESLVGHLRDRLLLLVLDNCEHLVTVCAALAELILRRCPGVAILATSREALRIAGERIYRVPPLSLPDANIALLIAELLQADAVRLFVARAAAAEPGFVLTLQNAETIVEICRRLEGIPLALELAAAWVPVLSLEEIAARLDDRLQLLTRAVRTALPHQQTLRTAIDWSYALLSEPEQTVLLRLAVFRGGAGLDAAEAVCADPPLQGYAFLGILTQLVDKSLVIAETQSGIARYQLLETIRQYALEKLQASGEAAAIQARHGVWFGDFAEQAERQLRGPEQRTWLARLEREHDNLRAVLDASEAGLALRTAGALGRFWEVRGYLSEGRQRLEQALAQGTSLAPTLRAKALHAAGLLAQHQGAHESSRSLYEQALAVRWEQQDGLGAANELNNLGILARDAGEPGRAAALHEQALALRRAAGDALGIAMSLNNLGILARDRADYVRAETFYEESLRLCRELGDQQGIASAVVNLGEVAHLQGEHPRAVDLITQGLALYRDLGDKQRLAFTIEDLAAATNALGHHARAAQLCGAAAAIRAEIGAPLAAVDSGDYDALVATLQAALGEGVYLEALNMGQTLSLDELCATDDTAPAGSC